MSGFIMYFYRKRLGRNILWIEESLQAGYPVPRQAPVEAVVAVAGKDNLVRDLVCMEGSVGKGQTVPKCHYRQN